MFLVLDTHDPDGVWKGWGQETNFTGVRTMGDFQGAVFLPTVSLESSA